MECLSARDPEWQQKAARLFENRVERFGLSDLSLSVEETRQVQMFAYQRHLYLIREGTTLTFIRPPRPDGRLRPFSQTNRG